MKTQKSLKKKMIKKSSTLLVLFTIIPYAATAALRRGRIYPDTPIDNAEGIFDTNDVGEYDAMNGFKDIDTTSFDEGNAERNYDIDTIGIDNMSQIGNTKVYDSIEDINIEAVNKMMENTKEKAKVHKDYDYDLDSQEITVEDYKVGYKDDESEEYFEIEEGENDKFREGSIEEEKVKGYLSRSGEPPSQPSGRVIVHLQGIGDLQYSLGQWAGSKGQHRRLEGFKIDINDTDDDIYLEYMAHIQNVGDTQWTASYVGTKGKSLRLEGFAIRVRGNDSHKWSVQYRAHQQGVGDTRVMKDGDFCGTKGQHSRVEAIWVDLVSSNQSSKKVKVYNDCQFQGGAVELLPGSYDVAQLSDMGVLNDSLSSITIPKGLEVTIYEHGSFDGSSKTLRSSVDCHTRIGSIIVNNYFNDDDQSIVNCHGYFCDKYLDTMFIVMTHNSLAVAGKVFSPNQNYGLATQFKDGIRGFNLDLYMDGGEAIKTCHGLDYCYNPQSEIYDLMNELNKDNNEVIFVQLESHIDAVGYNIVRNWFGEKLVKNFDPSMTFGYYLAQGQQVVLFTDKREHADESKGIHDTNEFITENNYEWRNGNTPPMGHRRGPTNPHRQKRYMRLMNYFHSATGLGDMIKSASVHKVGKALANIRTYETQTYAGDKVNALLVDYYEQGRKAKGQQEVFIIEYVMRNAGSKGIKELNACPYTWDGMCAGSFECGKKDYWNQNKYVCCKDTFVPFGWTTDLCVVEKEDERCGTTEDAECAGSLECGKKDYWNEDKYVCCKDTFVPPGWTTDLCVAQNAGDRCGTTNDNECAGGMACARTTHGGDYKCCWGTYDCYPWTPNCQTGKQYCLNGNGVPYKVTVKTGNKSGAGTDSNIDIIIYGDKGNTGWHRLNNKIDGNAFERGGTDVAVVYSTGDVGYLRSVSIKSDDKWAGSDWYLEYILINDGRVARFNEWIEKAGRIHSKNF